MSPTKLLRWRLARGLTQSQVSRLVRIARPHYSRIESGLRQPSLQVALRLAQLTGLHVEDLFDPVSGRAASDGAESSVPDAGRGAFHLSQGREGGE